MPKRFRDRELNLSALKKAIVTDLTYIGLSTAQAQVPVDTGNLRSSLRVLSSGKHGKKISSNVVYSGYVELGSERKLKDGGTKRTAAQPYMKPAVGEIRSHEAESVKKYLEKMLHD